MEHKESKTDRQERIPNFRQQMIHDTRVCVVGAGATGNEVLKCLALTGFGYVFIPDMDIISTSNLSRTVLFTEKDVGAGKAITAAERFCQMNIDQCKADHFDGDICHGLGEGVLRHVDIVVGCVDNEQTRLFLSNICQLLRKPYIDTGIEGLNWNVFPASGQEGCACYACTLSKKGRAKALSRIRNSCDVTRIKAAIEKKVPTIGVSAAMAAALAVQEVIKISHQLHNPDSEFFKPGYGNMYCFEAWDNELKRIHFNISQDCEHHDSYDRYGGVRETPISAHWTLRKTLEWVCRQYKTEYTISLYKDTVCSDRSFITRAFCEHCGTEIDIFRPQPLQDEDMLCEKCKAQSRQPLTPSNAVVKNSFSLTDEIRLQEMTLLELGIPLFHILEFDPVDPEKETLFLELTGDIGEVMPNLA